MSELKVLELTLNLANHLIEENERLKAGNAALLNALNIALDILIDVTNSPEVQRKVLELKAEINGTHI